MTDLETFTAVLRKTGSAKRVKASSARLRVIFPSRIRSTYWSIRRPPLRGNLPYVIYGYPSFDCPLPPAQILIQVLALPTTSINGVAKRVLASLPLPILARSAVFCCPFITYKQVDGVHDLL